VAVRSLASVADNVHATDHLTDGEEADDLGGSDTGEGELLGAGVADASQEVLGRGEDDAPEGGRVLEGVGQGLEVGLEGGQGTRDGLLDRVCARGVQAAGTAYGGVMFWPRTTSLASSMPTFV